MPICIHAADGTVKVVKVKGIHPDTEYFLSQRRRANMFNHMDAEEVIIKRVLPLYMNLANADPKDYDWSIKWIEWTEEAVHAEFKIIYGNSYDKERCEKLISKVLNNSVPEDMHFIFNLIQIK
jgi:hypothetical protein